ncbi:MAG: ribonuclease III [Acidimicrobiia bacterium]
MRTLSEILGLSFRDPTLLDLALTHRSVSAENLDRSDNERMEFLGDAVLQLAVTDRLYADYPNLPEGQMAKVRAAVVSGSSLAEAARAMGLGSYLELSASEERSGGRSKDSILADALEAVIGAVFLDSGYPAAEKLVLSLLGSRIEEKALNPGLKDYKTRLQEVLAAAGKRPTYTVTGTGPDHQRTFSAMISVEGEVLGAGEGNSKKAAEQVAAQRALKHLM